MTDSQFQTLCQEAFAEFVKQVPNPKTRYKKGGSTGNMAFNAARMEFSDPATYIISMDEDIAPYVPYTNEPWLSPHWKGKKNPNEGWFERTARRIAENTAKYCGGTITKWSKRK